MDRDFEKGREDLFLDALQDHGAFAAQAIWPECDLVSGEFPCESFDLIRVLHRRLEGERVLRHPGIGKRGGLPIHGDSPGQRLLGSLQVQYNLGPASRFSLPFARQPRRSIDNRHQHEGDCGAGDGAGWCGGGVRSGGTGAGLLAGSPRYGRLTRHEPEWRH